MLLPLLSFLKQGMTAKKLALTITLGFCIGIIPFVGINSLLLTFLALIFRLNIIAIQTINYSVYFLQIILFVPFLKLGQYIFNGPKIPFNIDNVVMLFQTSFLDTFISFWQINLLGLIVWMIITIPLGFLIYRLSLSFFIKEKLKMKMKST
jgi:uncharacterized protein (DUF2062 family)